MQQRKTKEHPDQRQTCETLLATEAETVGIFTHEILKLLLTVPVACERAFSAMRRFKEWEERLCGLALLFTHRDAEVSFSF